MNGVNLSRWRGLDAILIVWRIRSVRLIVIGLGLALFLASDEVAVAYLMSIEFRLLNIVN